MPPGGAAGRGADSVQGAPRGPDSAPSPTSYRLILEPRNPDSRRARNSPPPPPPPGWATEETVVQQRASEPPPAAMSASCYRPGDILARRYRLLDPLGEGGMGSVWRARSLGLDVDVALKLIRPDTEVPNAADRLLKEARAAARVVHPAAVRVYDYAVTEAGDPFLVMELLQGMSLSRRIATEGPMSAVEAVRTMLPVIGALAAAHREGLVHRDVKPANIMLVDEGDRAVPKLIDFGIVGVIESAWPRKLTVRGMMMGSPVYMAPEQVRALGDLDQRTDIWGVCVTLYELASGERPFDAPTTRETVLQVLGTRAQRPAALDAEPALWSIVQRGLAKVPDARWPSMNALGRALAVWAAERGVISDAAGAALVPCWLNPPRRAR